MLLRPLSRSLAPLLLLVSLAAAACGGETVGAESGGGTESGQSGAVDGSHGSSGSGASSATVATDSESDRVTASTSFDDQACVTITLTAADTACQQASDCQLASSGSVCPGNCDCGDTPVNNAAASRISSQVDGIAVDDCPCAFPGEPSCVGGQCVLCQGGPTDPAGCPGTVTVPQPDGGDAGQCVDVDLATYKTDCQQPSDCILIASGELCDGGCNCPGSTVSASELPRWDAATSGLTFGACACPESFTPSCISGQCVICSGLPGEPLACSDAGASTTGKHG